MQEYDNPVVQGIVHSMIAAEMRSFAPGDYLAYLPKPELRFENSSALQVIFYLGTRRRWKRQLSFAFHFLQAEMQRLETAPSSSSGKLVMDRYMADRPSNKQEKDEEVQYFSVFLYVHKQTSFSIEIHLALAHIFHIVFHWFAGLDCRCWQR